MGFSLMLWALPFFSQTTLSAGDIAVLAYNFDNSDQIVFVPLVDLESGTQIKFTDNGWNGTALTTSEGTYSWTASTPIAKGTIISVLPTSVAFSTSGDQIFVYQGLSTAPNFIFGLSSRPWVTGSISSTTSRKPSALTNGTTAIAFSSEVDNGYFNQVNTSGTKDEILTLICNTSKWTRSNNRYSSFPNWNITVSGGGVPVITEPLVQATNIVFNNVTSYSGNVSFTGNSQVEGYIVVRSDNAQLSTLPTDGINYTVGTSIGNGKVVAIGTSTNILQKGWRAGQQYYFTVLSYIDSQTSINYRQADPAIASVYTPNDMIGNYYNGISESSSNFISALQTKISSPHVKVSYGNYDETMVTQYEFRDTTNNQKVQECAYSGFTYVYTPPFVWYTNSPFSREHTWCVSWMPSSGSSSSYEYQDQHHLFTVVQNNANGVRSNHPLGDVVTPTSTYLEGQLGLDVSGNLVYEPRDEQKGDAARALLYMALRYDGVNGQDWSFDYLNNVKLPSLNEDPQDLQTLINWHNNDLPDDYEMSRNDYIQSIQQNRNPFVDHPEWVSAIDFGAMTWISPENRNLEVEQTAVSSEFKFKAFPNPANQQVWITIDPEMTVSLLEIYDITGRKIDSYNIGENTGGFYELNVESLPIGTYILRLSNEVMMHSCKLIKQ